MNVDTVREFRWVLPSVNPQSTLKNYMGFFSSNAPSTLKLVIEVEKDALVFKVRIKYVLTDGTITIYNGCELQ